MHIVSLHTREKSGEMTEKYELKYLQQQHLFKKYNKDWHKNTSY